MELLAGLGVGFLPELHGVSPVAFGQHEGDVKESFVGAGVLDVALGNVAPLEVAPVALREL